VSPSRRGSGHHQGRRAAFALGDDGDQRNHVEGHHPDARGEQNKKGGLLGKKLEAVVVDPASNWPLFAEKATQLLTQDKVAVVFGCWTSVSRKSVLPVFEKNNGLLFYPSSMKARSRRRTSSIPGRPRTSRRFRRSIT
jgi:hypothetical protein